MSKTVETPNMPHVSVKEAVSCLSGMYSQALQGAAELRALPSVMLWGPPGVGKSQAVRQIACNVESVTGRRAVVTDVRLLLFNPIDLRGIPVPNDDKTLAVWLRPQIFDMDPGDDIVNILLLDEISAAPPSVQAAAYQVTLDKRCGEHELPGNCVVIAAGNRLSDRSTAYRMPKALANRLLHLEVHADFDSWREWAVQSGVNDKVVAFLAFRPDRLFDFDPASDDLTFPSPRSWEMASTVLNSLNGDVEGAYPLISGILGVGMASELRTWSRVYGQLPDIASIFKGKSPAVPGSADALYALVSAMTAYARKHKDDARAIENSIAYAQKLPPDFSVLLLKDYLHLAPGYRSVLLRMPRFSRWVDEKGGLLDGIL